MNERESLDGDAACTAKESLAYKHQNVFNHLSFRWLNIKGPLNEFTTVKSYFPMG